jgi:CelD/BcsL family acetyltransferase involved in cellulose biosynthesis
LSVSVLRDLTELERLRGEWEQLLERSRGHHTALTPTWLIAWWRVFGPEGGRRLRALVVRDGRELVGLLLLVARRSVYRRILPMQRLEILASGEDQKDEIYSEYLGPIARAGREVEVAAALARHLDDDRDSWHEIVLTALDEQSPVVRALPPAFGAHGLACERQFNAKCPFIALPKRWDDYLAALSSDNRYMVRRSLRDFERWAGKRWTIEIATTHEDLARGKAILQRLHEHRWNSGGIAGAFSSTLFSRFHDLVMPELLDRGELDLRWLVVDGAPIAASYCVVRDNRLYYVQGGRATDVPKGVRPGIVLHLHTIRAAIEAGRLEYDFLGGDARYKDQLATSVRTLIELRVMRPSVPSAVRSALEASRKVYVRARAALRAEQTKRAAQSAGEASATPSATPSEDPS